MMFYEKSFIIAKSRFGDPFHIIKIPNKFDKLRFLTRNRLDLLERRLLYYLTFEDVKHDKNKYDEINKNRQLIDETMNKVYSFPFSKRPGMKNNSCIFSNVDRSETTTKKFDNYRIQKEKVFKDMENDKLVIHIDIGE